MGYIATDIARIPSAGYEYYVYMLLDGWEDPFRDELFKNFDRFSAAVGPNCLVVRGAEPEAFYSSLLETQLMSAGKSKVRLPALVVSNRPPSGVDESSGAVNYEGLRIFVFPLTTRYIKPGSITDFLKGLAIAIKCGDLEESDEGVLRSKWEWLSDYIELKPNFYGLGVNLNKVLDDIFASKRKSRM